jgi:hypothetical protein
MDKFQIGYFIGFGWAMSGANAPENFYDPKHSTLAGCDPYTELFGDAMFQGYHDAIKLMA